MKVLIAAVGKLKAGPELALFSEYTKRLPWKIEVKEIKPQGMEAEVPLLLAATEICDKRVLLDERGKTFSSREFADQLKNWQMQDHSHIGFIVGGADGASETLRKKADLLLAFGRMSWPHMLARAMLAEQLYRASTLISGHPYHRE